MNKNIIEKLEKVFKVIGVLTFGVLVVYICFDIYRFFIAAKQPGYAAMRVSYSNSAYTILNSLSGALFMFLMSTVFAIMLGKKKINIEKVDKLMYATCFTKVGALILGLYSSLSIRQNYINWDQPLQILTQFSFLSIYGMNAVYIVTIYVLYTYFRTLEEFKSEVI